MDLPKDQAAKSTVDADGEAYPEVCHKTSYVDLLTISLIPHRLIEESCHVIVRGPDNLHKEEKDAKSEWEL